MLAQSRVGMALPGVPVGEGLGEEGCSSWALGG